MQSSLPWRSKILVLITMITIIVVTTEIRNSSVNSDYDLDCVRYPTMCSMRFNVDHPKTLPERKKLRESIPKKANLWTYSRLLDLQQPYIGLLL